MLAKNASDTSFMSESIFEKLPRWGKWEFNWTRDCIWREVTYNMIKFEHIQMFYNFVIAG